MNIPPEAIELLNSTLLALSLAVIGALGLALRRLVSLGSEKFVAWFDAKARETDSMAHQAALMCVTEKLGTWSTAAVTEVEQTVVRALKRDGEWNERTALEARDAAVAIMRRHAGPAGMAELRKCTGLDEEVIIGMFRTWIENTVHRMTKKGGGESPVVGLGPQARPEQPADPAGDHRSRPE